MSLVFSELLLLLVVEVLKEEVAAGFRSLAVEVVRVEVVVVMKKKKEEEAVSQPARLGAARSLLLLEGCP